MSETTVVAPPITDADWSIWREMLPTIRRCITAGVKKGRRWDAAPPFSGAAIEFEYTNWRGETAQRECVIMGVEFGATEWHPEDQWLLRGYDSEKQEERLFAMKDMRNVRFE